MEYQAGSRPYDGGRPRLGEHRNLLSSEFTSDAILPAWGGLRLQMWSLCRAEWGWEPETPFAKSLAFG